MQLSQKEKTFSQFISSLFKSILKFEHSPKKDRSHSSCVSESTGSEKRG